MKHRLLAALTAATALAAAATARAQGATAPPPPAPPAPSEQPGVVVPGSPAPTAAELLTAADTAVDAGNLAAAAPIYDRLTREHPASPEAAGARRALKIIGARNQPAPPAAAGMQPAPYAADGVVTRREPYSLRTSERLKLSTWEKLDFGTSAFLYGMSVGFSFSLSSDSTEGNALPAVAIGALVYTAGSVAYLNGANPDRGDLPLVLAIASYVPTTALLIASAVRENPDPQDTALLVAGSGLLAIPAAVLAARKWDLDPGDTQLVRDAGFWGLVLGTTSAFAFGGETVNQYGFEQYVSPSSRKVAGIGLAGLLGGLTLGTIGAMNSEVSLERVRVTTWGGYGGTVVGLLLGGASADSDRGVFTAMTIGGAVGLLITFFATSGLDGIPPDDAPTTAWRPRRLAPSLLPIAGVDGRTQTGLGISGALF